MKTKTKIDFYFHFRFCFHFHFRFCFCFHFRFCFRFCFCFHFRFCFCFHFHFCFCFRFCISFFFLGFLFKFYYGTSRPLYTWTELVRALLKTLSLVVFFSIFLTTNFCVLSNSLKFDDDKTFQNIPYLLDQAPTLD